MSKKPIIAIFRAFRGECFPPYRQTRPNWFSKYDCFYSFYKSFKHVADIHVVWDGETNFLVDYIRQFNVKITFIDKKSNAQSMMACYELLEQNLKNYEYVYFSEDDWMYLKDAGRILLEGFQFPVFKDHFLTLYDRPHGYLRPHDDITFGDDYIFRTKTSHWRSAESCMYTWGMNTSLFEKVKEDLYCFCLNPSGAVDRKMFRHFYQKNIRLFNPIPGQATHCVDVDLPLDWKVE